MVPQDLTPIVIAGPTGSGKSALALEMAQKMGGEIICADSRQIYQRMPIGVACPTLEEYAMVQHHGFERLDPKENYNAGQFIADTDVYVAEIQSRGKTPILVGGTGLYLRAWRFGLNDVSPADPTVRARLDGQSIETLYEKLAQVDPDSAEKIKPTDAVRIRRALEIHEVGGQAASALRRTDWTRAPRVQAHWFLLKPSKSELDVRLKKRVAQMFDRGLREEALALREYLGSEDANGRLKTPGYAEALAWADGTMTKNEALERTFFRHRQYAKRQNTWFQKEPWWVMEIK